MTRESRLSTGHQLIDQRRYGEAVSYFKKLLQADPHPHVKMALASAYAGRAGIRIEKIYTFVVLRDFQAEAVSLEGLSLNQQTENLVRSLARYAEHWKKVPVLSEQGRADVGHAVEVLQQDTNAGVRLYSGVLRVVLLKSVVEQGLQSWGQVTAQSLCSDQLQPYFQWMLELTDTLIFISRDLQGAFPDRQKEFAKYETELAVFKAEAQKIPWPQEKICF
ncbi:hypothetical protein EZJ49_07785 [Bdellovibrio bacteriovorus]|uniref:hypothetical protein n=1 Tax=Bdellovibrio bacteriovorus TaxID=959 RepID=UPI0021D20B40|nr:hypothetical protein [Bdellovibrio bacteriovorus]UXR66149.1 hypothetical protein EZJ49_07785 [Bdellovibrio bacteriovorus]